MSSGCDWVRLFTDMATGALPYLQLYARRNMRGGSLGGMRQYHRRFQAPVPSSYTSQSGRGLKGVTIVAPTQQMVERAKAMKKQEDTVAKQPLMAPTKRKPPGTRAQKRRKPPTGKTSRKVAPKRKKVPPSQKKTGIAKDVFGNK